VKYFGKLDLASFACTDITRSSFIKGRKAPPSDRRQFLAKSAALDDETRTSEILEEGAREWLERRRQPRPET
jgi:hypothetical protein